MPIRLLLNSARFVSSVLILLLAAAPAWAQSDAGVRQGLSLEERVACRMIIEDIRWSHRIWPKENPMPKPPRAEVFSDAQIRAAVEDSLRMEVALRELYGIRIDEAMLQAEMDRMARNSLMPDRLQELMDALGNDPILVAECLVRPRLASRLLRDQYAWDDRLHGSLRKQVEIMLSGGSNQQQMFEHGRVENRLMIVRAHTSDAAEESTGGGVKIELGDEEFEDWFVRAQKWVDYREMGFPGRLKETREAFVYEKFQDVSHDRLSLYRSTWKKQPFDGWWRESRTHYLNVDKKKVVKGLHLPVVHGGVSGMQQLPVAIDADTWRYSNIPTMRKEHLAIWTGSEMIIWRGRTPDNMEDVYGGSRYNPVTDSWTSISLQGAPLSKEKYSIAWTGKEMFVWGHDFSGAGGGRYDPVTNSWKDVSLTNAPVGIWNGSSAVWTGDDVLVWGTDRDGVGVGGRYDPDLDAWERIDAMGAPGIRDGYTVVWTGSEMIVWGGEGLDWDPSNTGGRYDPDTDTWKTVSNINAPEARMNHTAVWTGREMLIWGGEGNSAPDLNTGGRYDPVTDSWQPIQLAGAPSRRTRHTSVWTGERMLVWGGQEGSLIGDGAAYDPVNDRWAAIGQLGAPDPRSEHSAVWTGKEMIVWGGQGDGEISAGARYDPVSDRWRPVNGAPGRRSEHTAVWTGNEMIIWGGSGASICAFTGSRYDPADDSWMSMATVDAPTCRYEHSAVWTGREMIVWGGNDPSFYKRDDGGRYDPMTDTWKTLSELNAPAARTLHTAVWTGKEMIIWGGRGQGSTFGFGSGYDPEEDRWRAITSVGAPQARMKHTAIWDGARMLIWGGVGTSYLNDGGLYDPVQDTWETMSAVNTLQGRASHSVVWTGDEMLVWGGENNGTRLDSGGRYTPATDSWSTMSMDGAPSARADHTAVWTGSEMLVWGGGWWQSHEHLNTGARYDPVDDTWTEITLVNAPSPSVSHSAVWTGASMLVWGAGRQGDVVAMYYPYRQYFLDVPYDHWAYSAVEALANSGVTSGCGHGRYCVEALLTRAEAAVFLEKGVHGGAYTPPLATGTVFGDVPPDHWAAAWIEQLAMDGITSGCGGGNYCPEVALDRASMAVFLLRAVHGSAYQPPPATGSVFDDVPADHRAAAWIEQLVAEGVTSGCGGGNYCPDALVTRAQMAMFLVRAFGL
ncbi:Kelch repeat-containing protein [Thiolapillus sp.]